MVIFACGKCGSAAYFDNTVCVTCGSGLGYAPDRGEMIAVGADDSYGRCANAAHDACNWLVPAGEGKELCLACRHNRTVPDLSNPQHVRNWRRIEAAKRHLFYSLIRWNLPLINTDEEPQDGLAFDFLSDVVGPDGKVKPALTGHDDGLITINIAEGDDAERELRRTQMGEPYRTLLGHLRHESGHYFWDRLVRDGGRLDEYREIFGDDRQDYAEALKRHYADGPPMGWQSAFISSYATSHPWEDFAECWAHYIHIVDTLETARAFGMRLRHPDGRLAQAVFEPYRASSMQELVDGWVPLTVAINAVNRSMGQPDLYPFVLSGPVVGKLRFVHELVSASARDGSSTG